MGGLAINFGWTETNLATKNMKELYLKIEDFIIKAFKWMYKDSNRIRFEIITDLLYVWLLYWFIYYALKYIEGLFDDYNYHSDDISTVVFFLGLTYLLKRWRWKYVEKKMKKQGK